MPDLAKKLPKSPMVRSNLLPGETVEAAVLLLLQRDGVPKEGLAAGAGAIASGYRLALSATGVQFKQGRTILALSSQRLLVFSVNPLGLAKQLDAQFELSTVQNIELARKGIVWRIVVRFSDGSMLGFKVPATVDPNRARFIRAFARLKSLPPPTPAVTPAPPVGSPASAPSIGTVERPPIDAATACSRVVLGVPSPLLEELRFRNDAFMDALAGAELRAGHRVAFQGLTLEILELEPGPAARVTGTTDLRIRAVDHPTLACPECSTMPEAGDAFCVGCGKPLPLLQLAPR